MHLEAAQLCGAHELQGGLEDQANGDVADALPQPLHLSSMQPALSLNFTRRLKPSNVVQRILGPTTRQMY